MKFLVEMGYIEDTDLFYKMTTVEGVTFRRNEREDNRFCGQDYEKDDYICFNYVNKTRDVGEIHGRLLAGRKKILFNPLCSKLIDEFVFDTPESSYQRIRSMGLNVGQTVNIPTRTITNDTRKFLWEELEYWPECTEQERSDVSHRLRYKCTTPTPVHVINTADAVSQLNEMKSPIELL